MDEFEMEMWHVPYVQKEKYKCLMSMSMCNLNFVYRCTSYHT